MKTDKDFEDLVKAWPLMPFTVKAKIGLMVAQDLIKAGSIVGALGILVDFFFFLVLAGLTAIVLVVDLVILVGV